MKAIEVLYHFQEIATWVNWKRRIDQFIYGDPETEITGIATGWTLTNAAIKTAHEKGLNLFITHEEPFVRPFEGTRSGDKVIRDKKKLLDECGMVVLRCHDTWDRMPRYGVPDAWAKFLGFEVEERPVELFYNVCRVPSLSFAETAREVLRRVRSLGQESVQFLGDLDRTVDKLVVGTGGCTHLPTMLDLGGDALVAADDGMDSWCGGLWALDLDIPVLIVNHATAEIPGMMAMVDYLQQQFSGVSAEYIDIDLPFRSVRSAP